MPGPGGFAFFSQPAIIGIIKKTIKKILNIFCIDGLSFKQIMPF
jgi:hypothetical protein